MPKKSAISLLITITFYSTIIAISYFISERFEMFSLSVLVVLGAITYIRALITIEEKIIQMVINDA